MRKSKTGARLLSVLMTLALLLGLLPTAAFAEEIGGDETSYVAEQASEDDGLEVQAVGTTSESYGDASTYTAAWKDSNYEAGTYTVTANIKMPGKYNPILTGIDVYANNPNNPFGPTVDPDDPYTDASTVSAIAPTTPLSMNAELTVGADGTLELSLPIQNPIFTTQKVGTCDNLAYTAIRLDKQYIYNAGDKTYTVDGRVYLLDATLGKTDLDNGVATYIFKGSKLYALPLDLTFEPDGDVALELTVDLSKIPEKTETPDDGSQKFTPGDVTRTAPLDLCVGPDRNNGVCVSERKSIDKLKTEGWKWEQNEDGSGGTLPTTHMGIYVGNGQFIHASTTSYRVQYDNVYGSYYTPYIVGVKRIS